MIVKEFFGTKIINASFLFANSNISVKYYSKDFPSVNEASFAHFSLARISADIIIYIFTYPILKAFHLS